MSQSDRPTAPYHAVGAQPTLPGIWRALSGLAGIIALAWVMALGAPAERAQAQTRKAAQEKSTGRKPRKKAQTPSRLQNRTLDGAGTSTDRATPAEPARTARTAPTEAAAMGGTAGTPASAPPLPKGQTPVLTQTPTGTVDWTGQYIEATGEAIIDTDRFPNQAQARAMAIRGATVVAQRNLLEIVKGVQVNSETTVENMITTSDFISTRVEGIVKGAQRIGEPQVRDGMATVRLRMPLYAQGGLAPVIYEGLEQSDAQANRSTDPAVGQPGSAAMRTGAAEASTAAGASGRNIAFNLGGKKFDPALFPVIADEQGNVLLDTRRLYDPKTGKFPEIIQATRQAMDAAGMRKGTEVLDVIEASNGQIRISEASKGRIPWDKIARGAMTAFKIIKMILL